MSGPTPFAAYDLLPLGIIALRGDQAVYANAAAAALLDTPIDAIVGRGAKELASLTLSDADQKLAHQLTDAMVRGESVPPEVWLSLAPRGDEERSARIVQVPGQAPNERVIVLFSGGVEAENRKLAEALVVAALDLVRAKQEHEVLEAAVEAIHRQGYWTAALQLNGGKLKLVAQRQDPAMMENVGKLLGFSPMEFEWETSRVPYLQRLFEGRRAIFTQDIFQVMDEAHPPEIARMMRETLPQARMVDAPIFLGEVPWGFLSVQGAQLSLSSVRTVELFTHLISGALENVRHHRQAQARVEELTRLQQELVSRERLAALGEAAGVLSHEARNPLGAILNALAVLRRNPGLGPDGAVVLDIAEEEAFRLDALVRDLMELARPLEPRVRPVELGEVLDAAVSDLRRKLGKSFSSLEVSRGALPLPEVLADPALLRVAVENLLRNAAQIAGAQPVRVSLRTEESRVVFGVDDALPPAHSGTGDEPFDPFSIVRPRGTGLGLAVVKRVVEAQQGAVRARDGGARIEILLPVAASAEDSG